MYVGARTDTAIGSWLSELLRSPNVAHEDWAAGRPALLPTGQTFDAVRMRPELVHAAVSSTTGAVVSSALAEILDGPVICDPGGWFYALVPPQTTETWGSPMATVRGRGAWLAIPRLDRTGPPGVHWSVPIEQAGKLCSAQAVEELLRVGQERLEGVAP